jgi:drug/metabolite transporter (DMT)-like permease
MSARAWTAFAAVSILWGIPYLFIKVAVDDGVPPIFLAWVRVLMAAVVLLVLSHRAGVLKPALQRAHRRWFCSTRSSRSACRFLSIVVLGLFCTAAAFVLFGALIGEVGPGRATVITYISPIVAVALGVAVLDERPGAGAVAGLLLILAGSWLSTDGRLPPGLARLFARRSAAPGRP